MPASASGTLTLKAAGVLSPTDNVQVETLHRRGIPTIEEGNTVSYLIADERVVVQPSWSLIPTGVGGGDSFRLLFVSSNTRNASSSDISDYNTHVQDAAAAGHADIRSQSSLFTALASTNSVDARDNTGTTYTSTATGIPIYWLNGQRVARHYKDFYNGSWGSTIDKDEDGNGISGTVWTGSSNDGTASAPLGATGGQSRYGHPGRQNEHFERGVDDSSGLRHFYGLSPVFQVMSQPVAPVLSQATVDGTRLTLIYDDALDETSIPAMTAYTVTVDGSTVTVSAVGVKGSTVTLALASAAQTGQTVTATYVVPGANPIRGSNGLEAAALPSQVVTNNTAPPALTAKSVDGATLTLLYNEPLDETSSPATAAYTVTVGGSTVTVSRVDVSGSRVTLTLVPSVQAGQTVTVSYAVPRTNPLQDLGGTDAAALMNESVSNTTVAVPPLFVGATVDGTALTLSYNERLDENSSPATSAYTVTVGGSTVTVSRVDVSGSRVTLTLESSVQAGEIVAVSYTVPGTNPLQDVGGTDAGPLTNEQVVNNTGLPVLSPKASPFFVHEGDSTEYFVTLSSPATQNISVAYATSSGTADQGTDFTAATGILTFALGQTEQSFTLQTTEDALVEGDETFSITLSGATGAQLEGGGLTLVERVLIDDDDSVPQLLYAAVTGPTLELAYHAVLDTASAPDPTDFVVKVGGIPRTVSTVSVGQPLGALSTVITKITLTLSTEVAASELVSVSYTPGTSPIRNSMGTPAEALVDQSVWNLTLTVPSSWSLLPTGISAGESFRLLFVSTTTRDATSTDISDYNEHVQNAVASGHADIQVYSSLFKALGSTSAISARRNTDTTFTSTVTGVPIYWINGQRVARHYKDFYNGSWGSSVDKDENGDGISGTVWTGTADNGTASAPLGSADGQVRYGHPARQDDHFDRGVASSTTERHLYGLSPVFTLAGGGIAGAPRVIAATVDGNRLTLTYDEPLDENSEPSTSDYLVAVDGSAATVSSVTVDGSEVTLTLAAVVTTGQVVRVSYVVPGTNPVQDSGGTDAGALTNRPVTNASAPPTLSAATVEGATLTLVYGEALDTGAEPATSAFTVTVTGNGRNVIGVAVSGSTVTLTLASAVRAGQAVTVAYSKPATNALRDLAGNEAADFSAQDADSGTGISTVALTSDAGSDSTYKIGDTVQATVTFTAAVDVDTTNGTPKLELDIGGEGRQAGYARGSGTTALVFTYRVAADDEDTDGIAIGASKLARNGGTIQADGEDAELVHAAVAANARHKVDGVLPTLQGAAVSDTALVLTYSEALDEDAQPAASAFTVTVGGDSRSVTEVAVSESKVTLTLAAPAVAAGETVTVAYTKPGTDALRDLAGNQAAGFAARDVDSGTGITAVALTSNAGSDSTYKLGDKVEATVTFTAAVDVDTTNGRPQLELDIGGEPHQAAYADGTGTTALEFEYTVAAGDADTDGIAIGASRLTLNGGTIQADGEAAALGHQAVAASASHKVDGVLPTLQGATVVGTALKLVYSEALDTGSKPANGDFAVTVASADRSVTAVGMSGTTVTLTLAAPAVTVGQAVTVAYSQPATNALQDPAGNQAAGFAARDVDSGTTVSTVALTSDAGSDSTYKIGDTVRATVTFAAAVDVDTTNGRPQLELDVGGQGRQAAYASGDGTTALVFAYRVAADDADTDGIAIGADKLALNGGTIQAGLVAATLAHQAVAASASHKVDGVLPTLQGATVSDTALVLTYSEALDEDAGPAASAFAVTVASDSRSVTEVAVSGSAVTLTLAEPAVAAGEAVTVAYTQPGTDALRDLAGNQAAGFAARDVDSGTGITAVALTSNAGSDSTYKLGDKVEATVTFTAAVDVDTTDGKPQLELDIGGEPRQAAYADGTGTTALEFEYTVAAGDADTDGIAIGASKLALNGGTIKADGEAAALGHAAVAASASHKVDGVLPTLQGAAVVGSALKLVYSEALDTGSKPANGDFAVTVANTDRSVTAVGMSGTTVTLTLAAPAVTVGQAVTVAYSQPATNALQDPAGNQAAGFAARDVDSGTTVSTVALTSEAGSDSTYKIGDTVRATVTFAAAVDVDTTNGRPQLELDIGGQGRQAAYASGDGTTALVFAYRVAADDADTDGIAIGADKLALNGGTIQAGLVAATLAHQAVAASASHKVDGVLPTLQGATVSDTALALTYSEALDEDAEPAASAFAVTVASTDRTVTGVEVSGSAVTLTLAEPAVAAGETVTVAYTKPGTDALRDLAGNQAAGFSAQTVDSGTGITAVALTSNAGSDSTYKLGDKVEATVTFTAAVDVDTTDGKPQLELDIGGEPRQAAYADGTGTTALEFEYTVAAGDADTDGIAIGASKLALNGGTIKADGEAAALGHAGGGGQRQPQGRRGAADAAGRRGRGLGAEAGLLRGAGHGLEAGERRLRGDGGERGPQRDRGGHERDDGDADAGGPGGDGGAGGDGGLQPAGDERAAGPGRQPGGGLRGAGRGQRHDGLDGGADVGRGVGLDLQDRRHGAGDGDVRGGGGRGHDQRPAAAGAGRRRAGAPGGLRQRRRHDRTGVRLQGGGGRRGHRRDRDRGRQAGAERRHDPGGAGGRDAGAPGGGGQRQPQGGRGAADAAGRDGLGHGAGADVLGGAGRGRGPAASAFTVTVASDSRSVTEVAVSGSAVTLTLADPAVAAGETVTVAYTKPGTDALRDLAGNQAAGFSAQTVDSGTGITAVALTSNAGSDSTYKLGDKVEATVTFTAAVDVDTTDGKPQLELDIGGEPRQAAYADGTGTTALEFEYTVAAGDADTDGIAIGASKLALNGGTIKADGEAAALGHQAVAASASHKVDGVLPTLQGAGVVGSALKLVYSEALDTGSKPANGDFAVTVASADRSVTAVGMSGTTVTLTLAAPAVTVGQAVTVAYSQPATNALQDPAGNQAAGFAARDVDSGTTVSTVALTSDAGSDSTYKIGDTVRATVTFAAAVDVDTTNGRPQLELDIGGQGRQAAYASGDGTTALVFAYRVAADDADTDGIAIGADKLALNGGTIQAGLVAATLAHQAVAASASHKVDGVLPTLQGATVSDTALALTYSEALDEDAGRRPRRSR